MANTGRVTQSIVLAGTLQNGTARVTQSFLIAAIGVGINCGNPPAGIVGAVYSHIFPSGGGDPPYTFSITVGALPDGLMLNASTGAVSGTPTRTGPFPFTVQIVDSMGGVASVACSIVVLQNTIIQLIGWKLYPNAPCADALPGLELPPVKRAV